MGKVTSAPAATVLDIFNMTFMISTWITHRLANLVDRLYRQGPSSDFPGKEMPAPEWSLSSILPS